ncbi:MAG: hypothetical protein ACXWVI_01790 [Methyloceanibacter sp.]
MFMRLSAAVMAALIVPANAGISSSTEPPQIYVQLIVKACPSNQPETQTGRPDAVRGYYAEPISQGGDNERSPTRAERESAFATMHCIDVPVPPEVIMGVPLTRQACMGHTGYLIAMQYLQKNPAYAKSFPDIGEWSCIEHAFPVSGVAGM